MAHNESKVSQLCTASCGITFKKKVKITWPRPIRSPVTIHLASEAHLALHTVADFGEIWTRIAHILCMHVYVSLFHNIPPLFCDNVTWAISLKYLEWRVLLRKKNPAIPNSKSGDSKQVNKTNTLFLYTVCKGHDRLDLQNNRLE